MEIELNKPDWFEAQAVIETPNFDKDQYGNTWYSVKFTQDATTYLWLAKEEPEEGKKYYGHVEATKSGKALRFKKDMVPEDKPAPAEANDKQASYAADPEKQAAINRAVALNNAVAYHVGGHESESNNTVITTAEEFYAWLQNEQPLIDPFDKPIYDVAPGDDVDGSFGNFSEPTDQWKA